MTMTRLHQIEFPRLFQLPGLTSKVSLPAPTPAIDLPEKTKPSLLDEADGTGDGGDGGN